MEIKYWRNNRGDAPVKIMIDELDPKTRKKILRAIFLVGEHGISVGPPLLKKMSGTTPSLYEIRKCNRRIYCHFDHSACWLLHMIHKKSWWAPKSDVGLAQDRAKKIITTNNNE